MPIRVAVTGQMHGPELPNTIEVLGKEKVLSRLQNMYKSFQDCHLHTLNSFF